jgi:hypothetical protein
LFGWFFVVVVVLVCCHPESYLVILHFPGLLLSSNEYILFY